MCVRRSDVVRPQPIDRDHYQNGRPLPILRGHARHASKNDRKRRYPKKISKTLFANHFA
jgi:hypothetical protein